MDGFYHIEGAKEFGYSTVNLYLNSFSLFKNTVKRLNDLYKYASVLDLKGYVTHFCYVRLKSFDTLLRVVVDNEDYIASACILRMLGDSVASFNLVYMEPDPELCLLRHALYVIDGCEENLKVLPEKVMIKKGVMPDEEIELLKKGNRFNRELRKRQIREAQLILDNSTLQSRDKEAFDKIVKARNWRFKEFKKDGVNSYSLTALYKRIGRSDDYDVLSFISQFAHGLSMSNLVLEMNAENRDGILYEAMVLMDKLHEYILNIFREEYCYIAKGLLEPKMRDEILSCYDDEHRPSIEMWNQHIKDLISRKEFLC